MFKVIKSNPNTTGNVTLKEFDSYRDAQEFLNEIGSNFESHGFEVSEIEADTLECVHDYHADVTVLYIE